MDKGEHTKQTKEITDLRHRNLESGSIPEFKTSFLSGYEKKGVDEYITGLKKQHERTLETYRERMEECTTFTGMLTNEKEELRLKTESLARSCEEYTAVIENLKVRLSEGTDKTAPLCAENDLLREELETAEKSISELNGEIGVIRLQLEKTMQALEKSKAENQELLEAHTRQRTDMRRTQRDRCCRTAEFKDRQLIRLRQSSDLLNEVLVFLDDLNRETEELVRFTEENGVQPE